VRIIDQSGVVEVRCDRCGVSVKGYQGEVIVGLQRDDIRVLHDACTTHEFQFLHTKGEVVRGELRRGASIPWMSSPQNEGGSDIAIVSLDKERGRWP